MRRISLLTIAAVALGLVAAGCGGGKGGVELSWQAAATDAQLAAENGGVQASPLKTVVYVSNDSGEVLHGALLRLSELDAENLAGFSIGTITNAATDFDGPTRVWSLGDLQPGARIGFPIGLWFSSQYISASPDSLSLVIELASPDLTAPVKSNALVLNLAH